MAKTQYEIKKNANKRYMEKLEKILIYLPGGAKERIKAAADEYGKSVNAYINGIILEKMGLQEWPKEEETGTETE